MNTVRIIWAIAAKDIVDAIKNKTSLSMILGVAVLVLSGQLGPFLSRMASEQQVLVYDAGRSSVIGELNRQDGVRLRGVRSEQALKEQLSKRDVGSVLGLVIPPDFDRMAQAGEALTLDGYFAYWLDGAETRTFFEQQLTQLADCPISIQTQAVYPPADSTGRHFMVTTVFVMVVMSICVILVPFLFIEEKKAKTFSVLLLSPVGIPQLVAGKALAGFVYGLIAGGIVLAFNHYLVLHWSIALLSAVCGAMFGVAVGLLLGSLFDDTQTLGLWTGLLMLALLGPAFLDSFTKIDALSSILPWMPAAALGRMFQLSFVERVPLSQFASHMGVVLGYSLLLYACVVWCVHRLNR